MKLFKITLICIVILIPLTGCNDLVGHSGNAVVLDLAVIAKATGQDEVIKKQLQQAGTNLTNQLTEVATNLEKQLENEKDKLGKTPDKKQQQQFQQLTLQANQKFRQTQSLAQKKVQEYEMGLLMEWRQKLQPIAQAIANDKGASIVLVSSPSLIWFDATVDITDEVIAKLRAQQGLEVSSSDKTSIMESADAISSEK